jgi:DNA-binding NtrC family response regulator
MWCAVFLKPIHETRVGLASSDESTATEEAIMGQARPVRSIALVIEADHDQRALIATLLEETELQVIECDSAEAALAVLQLKGGRVAMAFTDVELAGRLDGVELAQILKSNFPKVPVIVTSGDPRHPANLPASAIYMAKPWRALDVLMVAERARAAA